MTCKNCGGNRTSWFPTNRVNSVAVDGRLKSNEISCDFVLGCDECSETLKVVSADEVARQINMTHGREQVPTIKPLEWERGKIFLTAKSVDGAVFTIREINDSWRLATWSVIGAVKNLGLSPSLEAAKGAAQTLHNEAVAKYLSG